MLIIKVDSDNIEKALRQYKRKVINTKQLKALRDGTEYEKPSSKKRTQKARAKYMQSKHDSQNQ